MTIHIAAAPGRKPRPVIVDAAACKQILRDAEIAAEAIRQAQARVDEITGPAGRHAAALLRELAGGEEPSGDAVGAVSDPGAHDGCDCASCVACDRAAGPGWACRECGGLQPGAEPGGVPSLCPECAANRAGGAGITLPDCARCGRPAEGHGAHDDCGAWRSVPGWAMDAPESAAAQGAPLAGGLLAGALATGGLMPAGMLATSLLDTSVAVEADRVDGAGWPGGMRPRVLAPAGDDDVICATPGCGHRERHHFGQGKWDAAGRLRPCTGGVVAPGNGISCKCPNFTPPDGAAAAALAATEADDAWFLPGRAAELLAIPPNAYGAWRGHVISKAEVMFRDGRSLAGAAGNSEIVKALDDGAARMIRTWDIVWEGEYPEVVNEVDVSKPGEPVPVDRMPAAPEVAALAGAPLAGGTGFVAVPDEAPGEADGYAKAERAVGEVLDARDRERRSDSATSAETDDEDGGCREPSPGATACVRKAAHAVMAATPHRDAHGNEWDDDGWIVPAAALPANVRPARTVPLTSVAIRPLPRRATAAGVQIASVTR